MARAFEGWLDNATWVILFVLLVPSTFAVTSWNSLPGTRLYGIRLAMENALLAVAPSHQAKGQLYASFTERGAKDATRVLSDSGSTVGLTYLSAHVNAAKENIQKTSDPQVRSQLAKQYIATLREANATLEQQKQLMTTGYSPPRTPTPRLLSGGQPTSTPRRAPTRTPTPTPQAGEEPTPGDPIEEIEDAQDEIEDTIDELEDLSSSPTMGDDDEDKKDEGEKNKDKDKENNENKGNNNEDKENKDKDND